MPSRRRPRLRTLDRGAASLTIAQTTTHSDRMRVAFVALLLAACGPGGVRNDAADSNDAARSNDAGTDAIITAHDAGHDVGADAPSVCTNEDDWMCTSPSGGSGTVCCRGVVMMFYDGPCGPFDYPDVGPYPDAGSDTASQCAVYPRSAGCPCAVGATECDPTYHLVTCGAGTYTATARGCGACP